MDSNNLKVKNIIELYPNNTFYYFDEFTKAGCNVVVQLGDFWILDLVGARKFRKIEKRAIIVGIGVTLSEPRSHQSSDSLLFPPFLELLFIQMPLQPCKLVPKIPPTPPTLQIRIQIVLPPRMSPAIFPIQRKILDIDQERC